MFIDFNAKPLPFFVYGSLLRGLSNYGRIVANFPHSVTPGSVDNADMYAYKSYFPYVTAGEGTVIGELIEVDSEYFLPLLVNLDGLEGYTGAQDHTNHYVRKVVTVHTDNGDVEAYMYLASPETAITVRAECPRVSSGDWRGWREWYLQLSETLNNYSRSNA